jgi:hypothetical protein
MPRRKKYKVYGCFKVEHYTPPQPRTWSRAMCGGLVVPEHLAFARKLVERICKANAQRRLGKNSEAR